MAPLEVIKTFQSWDRLKEWDRMLWDRLQVPRIIKIVAISVWILLWTTNWVEARDWVGKNLIEITWWDEEIFECDLHLTAWNLPKEPLISTLKYDSQYYKCVIQDVYFEEWWEKFPKNLLSEDWFNDIVQNFIWPLHKVLVDAWFWGTFSWEDAVNIIELAMLIWKKWFSDKYDYVAGSFPRDDIDDLFRAKLAELFTPSSDI